MQDCKSSGHSCHKGYFISVEGTDGSGKSTQLDNMKAYFETRGIDALFIREPGGTSIGEQIRSILLDSSNSEMFDMTEAMLYAASRAQIVREVIEPALELGRVVVCDRFVDSSIAYQGYGRGMGNLIWDINKHAVGNCLPDCTFFLDISPSDAAERIMSRGESKDRMEEQKAEFHERVYEGYHSLISEDGESGRFHTIDARKSQDDVCNDVYCVLDSIFYPGKGEV